MDVPVIVYEDHLWQNFKPLVSLRAVCELASGTGTLLSTVERLVKKEHAPLSLWCRDNVADVVAERTGLPVNRPLTGPTLFLNGRGRWSKLPEVKHTDEISWIGVTKGGYIACIFVSSKDWNTIRLDHYRLFLTNPRNLLFFSRYIEEVGGAVELYDWPWDVVKANPQAIMSDWETEVSGWSNIDRDRSQQNHSLSLGTDTRVIGDGSFIDPFTILDSRWGRIEIGEMAIISSHSNIKGPAVIGVRSRIGSHVVFNTVNGPVWIGKNVSIGNHITLRGPVYIGSETVIHDHAHVSASTIGPHCRIGGEVSGSIFHGFGNKAHHGYVGDSYVCPWVNLGAGFTTANLKHTYGGVQVMTHEGLVNTKELHWGALIGDHTKLGVNVKTLPGAVVGIFSSVPTSPETNYIPPFSWIDEAGIIRQYYVKKAIEVARRVMARRGVDLTDAEAALIRQMSENRATR